MRLYTELVYFFPNTKLRHIIAAIECDVFLPSLNVAIEVDGFYWHRNQALKDKAKNEQLLKMGIDVFRVRGSGLPKIAAHDVIQRPGETELEICQRIVKSILNAGLVQPKDLRDVRRYLGANRLRNEALFLKLNNILPNPLPGTSLAELKPAIAKEWHPTENGIRTPADVTLSSAWKYWWKCARDEGHEWQSTIDSRVSGTGCPFCAGKRASKTNCLEAANSKLAGEWHINKNGRLTPKDVTASSGKRVWWQCPKDKQHVYDMTVHARMQGQGCPFCASRRIHKSNCLATKHPALLKWWHKSKNGSLTPFDVVTYSRKVAWWKCPKGHVFQQIIADRINATTCPICANRIVHPSNCLAHMRPEIAWEWHPSKNSNLTPRDVVPGSGRAVWWKCKKCGEEWRTKINERNQGTGCPVCSKKRRWLTRRERYGPTGGSGPGPNRKKVRSMDTNVVYPSIIEAAERTGVSEVGLRKALKAGKAIKGLQFAYAKGDYSHPSSRDRFRAACSIQPFSGKA